MVTCYDYTFARLLSKSPIDGILVGDSAAMVMHGHPSTLSASVELMRLHTEAVARGAAANSSSPTCRFFPFGKACRRRSDAASILMTAGAHAVKLEGVDGHEDVIERMTESGIPVMGHLGLQPQSVHSYGGFAFRGGARSPPRDIARQATALEELGVFAIVLECVPAKLSPREITATASIPDHRHRRRRRLRRPDPGASRSARHEPGPSTEIRPPVSGRGRQRHSDALARFDEAVKAGTFPSQEETYS